jgi:uncharacterized Ntn-hydrolase superfamily protein
MTFSIVARCTATGAFGVAVASSSPAVAARCAYVRSGVGAATSQNITDPMLGERLLALMAEGASAGEAIAIVQRTAPHIGYRQLTAIDVEGRTATFSGPHVLGTHAEAHGRDAVSAGNLLANADVPRRIVEAFERSSADALGDRILEAMRAGLRAGGEAGPVRSAGMLLADKVAWPVANLRVDWHDDPIEELVRVWQVYAPQMRAYVTRALDPREAPSYNVPGDP